MAMHALSSKSSPLTLSIGSPLHCVLFVDQMRKLGCGNGCVEDGGGGAVDEIEIELDDVKSASPVELRSVCRCA